MRKPPLHRLPGYLEATEWERKGFVVCCLLSLLCFLLPRSWPLLEPVIPALQRPAFDSTFFELVAELEALEARDSILQAAAAATEEFDKQLRLFPFDPNQADRKTLLELGLSPRIAKTILNYRRAGGHFRYREDLQKIYGLSPKDYERLEPFIQLPSRSERKQNSIRRLSSGAPSLPKDTLFQFDPNTVGFEELRSLGLPPWTARTWVNYRKKGAVFCRPEDLLKVYGMTDSLYQRLAPFVVIPADSAIATPLPAAPEPLTLDINHATKEDWQRLRGIGPTYASRIVNFREKLGGFISIEQVGETYNLPDSVFQKIRPHLQLSPIFRPLPLNRADFETLNAHPYIRYRQARFLLRYREQHGPIPDAAAFRQAARGVFSKDEIERLLPYLDFNYSTGE